MYCEDARAIPIVAEERALAATYVLDGLVRTLNWKQHIGVDTLVYRLFADTIFSVPLLME